MDIEQIDVLKNGFDGLDKENTGQISATGMQMIYKMIGLSVQVSFILLEKMTSNDNFFRNVLFPPDYIAFKLFRKLFWRRL